MLSVMLALTARQMIHMKCQLKSINVALANTEYHYENMPIQIYSKMENFQIKNSDIFPISSQSIDCGYSFEPPCQGSSNEYPQSMLFFLAK